MISDGGSKSYTIGDSAASYVFYYDQTPSCGIAYTYTYSVNGTTNPTLTWLTASQTDVLSYPKFTVQTSETIFAATHNVQLITSVYDGTTTFSKTISFSFVLVDPCPTATWLPVTINNMTTSILA